MEYHPVVGSTAPGAAPPHGQQPAHSGAGTAPCTYVPEDVAVPAAPGRPVPGGLLMTGMGGMVPDPVPFVMPVAAACARVVAEPMDVTFANGMELPLLRFSVTVGWLAPAAAVAAGA